MEVSAIATCCDCGSGVCPTCRNKMFGRNYCDVCAAKLEDKLVAKPAPAAAPVPAVAPAQVVVHSTPPQPAPPLRYGKSPGVATALSFFLAGAGQIYCGRVGRGLAIMVATYSLMPVLIGVPLWFWQLFDASTCAREENVRAQY